MNKITHISLIIPLLFGSCRSENAQSNPKSNGNSTPKENVARKKSSYVVPGSEFRLTHPNNRYKLTHTVEVDFENFVYDDFILSNGLSNLDSEVGFDTIRHINTHSFEQNLKLVEIYEYYGGGSSEILTLLYLFRRDHDKLRLLSKLTCDGNYPLEVANNVIKVKADNYKGGESARCCPWKHEIGEFKITKDGLEYIGREFEDIQN